MESAMPRNIPQLVRKTLRLTAITLAGLFVLALVMALTTAPQRVTAPIASLEQGVRPEADALHIPDGWLYWNGATTIYQEHLRTGEKRIDGYYVPVVSAEVAKQLEAGGDAADFTKVAVMAFITQETAQGEFPFLAANPFRTAGQRHPDASTHPVHGVVKPGKTMPLVFKRDVDSMLPGLDLDRLVVVAHDAPDESGAGLLGLGIILLGIFGVVGKRRRPRARQGATPLFENQGAVRDVVLGDRVGHDTQPHGLATLR
jgi:hypothetical protein